MCANFFLLIINIQTLNIDFLYIKKNRFTRFPPSPPLPLPLPPFSLHLSLPLSLLSPSLPLPLSLTTAKYVCTIFKYVKLIIRYIIFQTLRFNTQLKPFNKSSCG